ncbi:MAG: DUF364 domain-containing protein, partial [Acetomicrobium sp.]
PFILTVPGLLYCFIDRSPGLSPRVILDGLLERAKPGAQIVVAGPTASMLLDAFFKRYMTLL